MKLESMSSRYQDCRNQVCQAKAGLKAGRAGLCAMSKKLTRAHKPAPFLDRVSGAISSSSQAAASPMGQAAFLREAQLAVPALGFQTRFFCLNCCVASFALGTQTRLDTCKRFFNPSEVGLKARIPCK